jgi:DNA-binding CsgD family transcriptional regulator
MPLAVSLVGEDREPVLAQPPGLRAPAWRDHGAGATPVPVGRAEEYGDIFKVGDVFKLMVERTGVGLVVLDANLRIKRNNRAFVDHCGRLPVELHERDFSELLHPSVRQRMLRQFERLLHGRTSRFTEHLPALWASQTAFTGSLTGMALRGDVGEVQTVVVLITPEKSGDERRVLISPSKMLQQIDASILEGAATGETTVQLAINLFLSRQGIEYHVSNMFRQFKVPNRTALVSKAYAMGLFGVGSWPPKVLAEYIEN